MANNNILLFIYTDSKLTLLCNIIVVIIFIIIVNNSMAHCKIMLADKTIHLTKA